jgi:hypothetical protein
VIHYEVSNVFVIELQEIDVGIKKRSQSTAFARLIAFAVDDNSSGGSNALSLEDAQPANSGRSTFLSWKQYKPFSCEDAEGDHLTASQSKDIDGIAFKPEPTRSFSSSFDEFDCRDRVRDVGSPTICHQPHQAEQMCVVGIRLDQQVMVRTGLHNRRFEDLFSNAMDTLLSTAGLAGRPTDASLKQNHRVFPDVAAISMGLDLEYGVGVLVQRAIPELTDPRKQLTDQRQSIGF